MTEEPNWFREMMAWFCCALMAMILLAVAGGIAVLAIALVKTFGMFAISGLLSIAALTYGLRRYVW